MGAGKRVMTTSKHSQMAHTFYTFLTGPPKLVGGERGEDILELEIYPNAYNTVDSDKLPGDGIKSDHENSFQPQPARTSDVFRPLEVFSMARTNCQSHVPTRIHRLRYKEKGIKHSLMLQKATNLNKISIYAFETVFN